MEIVFYVHLLTHRDTRFRNRQIRSFEMTSGYGKPGKKVALLQNAVRTTRTTEAAKTGYVQDKDGTGKRNLSVRYESQGVMSQ